MGDMNDVKNKVAAMVITAKNKVGSLWNSGPKGKCVIIGVVGALLVIGILTDGEDEASAANECTSRSVKSTSPISGLAGYKLGDVYSGPLDKPADLFGPDWYEVPAIAPFLKFTDVSVQVTPMTHRIASIMAVTPSGVSDVTGELETLQAVLEKKFGKMEFEQKTPRGYEWHPGKGNRVIKIAVLQWPMVGNVISVGVYDGEISLEIKREREKRRQEKANRAAEGVDAGL